MQEMAFKRVKSEKKKIEGETTAPPRRSRLWHSLHAFGVSARIQAGVAIYLERVLILNCITKTGAEKLVVHIHENVTENDINLSFLLSIALFFNDKYYPMLLYKLE